MRIASRIGKMSTSIMSRRDRSLLTEVCSVSSQSPCFHTYKYLPVTGLTENDYRNPLIFSPLSEKNHQRNSEPLDAIANIKSHV